MAGSAVLAEQFQTALGEASFWSQVMIAGAYSTQHSSTVGFGPVNQMPADSGVFLAMREIEFLLAATLEKQARTEPSHS